MNMLTNQARLVLHIELTGVWPIIERKRTSSKLKMWTMILSRDKEMKWSGGLRCAGQWSVPKAFHDFGVGDAAAQTWSYEYCDHQRYWSLPSLANGNARRSIGRPSESAIKVITEFEPNRLTFCRSSTTNDIITLSKNRKSREAGMSRVAWWHVPGSQ